MQWILLGLICKIYGFKFHNSSYCHRNSVNRVGTTLLSDTHPNQYSDAIGLKTYELFLCFIN